MPTYHIKLVRQCWMGLPNGLGYPLMFRKKPTSEFWEFPMSGNLRKTSRFTYSRDYIKLVHHHDTYSHGISYMSKSIDI